MDEKICIDSPPEVKVANGLDEGWCAGVVGLHANHEIDTGRLR